MGTLTIASGRLAASTTSSPPSPPSRRRWTSPWPSCSSRRSFRPTTSRPGSSAIGGGRPPSPIRRGGRMPAGPAPERVERVVHGHQCVEREARVGAHGGSQARIGPVCGEASQARPLWHVTVQTGERLHEGESGTLGMRAVLLWDRVGHAAVFYSGATFAVLGSVALIVFVPGRPSGGHAGATQLKGNCSETRLLGRTARRAAQRIDLANQRVRGQVKRGTPGGVSGPPPTASPTPLEEGRRTRARTRNATGARA